MIKKLLIAILLSTCYLPLNAIQIDPIVSNFIDDITITIRGDILLQMREEKHNSERLENIKTQLLTELKYLQYLVNRRLKKLLGDIEKQDFYNIDEHIAMIDIGREALQILKNLESYCD